MSENLPGASELTPHERGNQLRERVLAAYSSYLGTLGLHPLKGSSLGEVDPDAAMSAIWDGIRSGALPRVAPGTSRRDGGRTLNAVVGGPLPETKPDWFQLGTEGAVRTPTEGNDQWTIAVEFDIDEVPTSPAGPDDVCIEQLYLPGEGNARFDTIWQRNQEKLGRFEELAAQAPPQ
ncbi:MAG TPA: hypothetical protein VLF62_03465 [Candidatus Saccharimonadales bacterium]|nr:hypothetical protein [Candidatus Saccharimonadales bacterium]